METKIRQTIIGILGVFGGILQFFVGLWQYTVGNKITGIVGIILGIGIEIVSFLYLHLIGKDKGE